MTRTELIASLTAGTEDIDGVYLGEGRYIDWSSETDDGRRVEVGEGPDAVQADWTWTEIERVQRALTLLLLSR